MITYAGQIASAGFSIGPVLVLKKEKISPRNLKYTDSKSEQNTLTVAIGRAIADLQNLIEKSKIEKKTESVQILEAHIILLEDPEVQDLTAQKINEGLPAESAYNLVIEDFKQMFLAVEDELIRQRATDLDDIRERVLFYMQNPNIKFPDLNLEQPTIIIAHDLTPSQILSMDKKNLLGFITTEGGGTSHTAILARSLEIPAIVGAEEKILNLSNGALVALNGERGQLFSDLSDSDKELFLNQKNIFERKAEENSKFIGQKTMTKDGVVITLAANISGPQDLTSFNKNDAESVGLYRTEFLFLDRTTAPSEEEQYKVYRDVFQGLNKKHILIRTLDIGGDKKADYLDMKHEENPFLGIRALRLCFQRPEIFKTQLRALLRAGVDADWGLMFPMVSQLEELLQAKAFIAEVTQELKNEGKAFSQNFEIGIMIEIPSAAWMMATLAGHVDFVSIGTNDLLQYTCAADRLNSELKSIYNPYNLGFLHQIHHILTTCHKTKVHSGICGSLSHHPDLLAFFIGCGVNELSMTSQHILSTRARILSLDFKKCEELVSQVLKCSTIEEAKNTFKKFWA